MAKKKTDTPQKTDQKTDQCHHVFVGSAEGVQCATCGLKLTTEEFQELLKADN